MGKLQGRTAIVTGGAHGLGRQFAAALAREGATVAVLDISNVETAAAEIAGREGNGCFGIATDVSDEAQVQAAVAAVLERTGRIDILVNNAAVFSSLPPVGFADIDVALWDKVMAVNLRGPFLMAKHAVEGVYDADPNTDPNAELLPELTHLEAIERGLQVMDVTALSLCMENRLPIHVFGLVDGNIKRVLTGERVGTIIRTPDKEQSE